jgi:GLPGLI family protein
MNKSIRLSFLFLVLFANASAQQDQKVVAECTVMFDLQVEDPNASEQVVKSLNGTTKIVYIKGNRSRTELISPAFLQSTIYNGRTDTVVVLRELGNGKYMSYLDGKKVADQNRKYNGVQFMPTTDTKTILGYDCKKVVAKLADGSTYNVYYAPAIIGSNRDYENQFKDLSGFVLEYESLSEDGKTKVTYSASKINFAPVPTAKFELPKTGYRLL